ncbi:FAD-binding domain-containing protein [Dichomitus squalens]|uniref:FAD-binding domain-containing protein n=1 Tax=Dichomitus squalens TaxID=114155 RepID=A0A4Q9Q4C1_9APHY|nr:FAD-binding domain-containing protein [Dichomitus squalens]TBU61891.1 FAD-binding domain-containing protein [Dichomitus squalens]
MFCLSFFSFVALGIAGAASVVSDDVLGVDLSLRERNSTTSLIDCLTRAGLNPVTPSNPTYQNDSLPVNLRLIYKPAALVYPNTTDDVSASVKCGAVNDVKVNARSGGHSYASFSTGGEDGHLVISLDNLNNITLSGDYVTIGTGNKLGPLYYFLWENGQRAAAFGTCPQVGVAGHLHGGFGYHGRKWGLFLDQVVEMEVVKADGSIVIANNHTNADLFWALRGAPPSFGIITRFTVLTHPAPTHAATFAFTYTWSTPEVASSAFQIFQHFAAETDLPSDLALQVRYTEATPVPTFSLNGAYYGNDGITGLNRTVQPLWDALGALNDSVPTATIFEDLNWIQNVVYEADSDPTIDPKVALQEAQGFQIPFYSNSLFYPADNLLTNASTLSFTRYTYNGTSADVNWYVLWDVFGGKNSAIAAVPQDATAYNARDMLMNLQILGYSTTLPYPDDGIPFITGILKSVTDPMPGGRFMGYPNYVDSQLSREEAHAWYYPTHTAKLQRIMREVNPKAVFDYPQGFLPT